MATSDRILITVFIGQLVSVILISKIEITVQTYIECSMTGFWQTKFVPLEPQQWKFPLEAEATVSGDTL
jgi:hypothetical protein